MKIRWNSTYWDNQDPEYWKNKQSKIMTLYGFLGVFLVLFDNRYMSIGIGIYLIMQGMLNLITFNKRNTGETSGKGSTTENN